MLGNSTEQAYARSDLFERRSTLMQQWADYLAGEPQGEPGTAAWAIVGSWSCDGQDLGTVVLVRVVPRYRPRLHPTRDVAGPPPDGGRADPYGPGEAPACMSR